MALSVFDLFKIGVGPSSSHTVGPMRAAYQFVQSLNQKQLLLDTTQVKVILYGSLASTGVGHATDKATLLGLMGFDPETIDTTKSEIYLTQLSEHKQLKLNDKHDIGFDTQHDLIFNEQALPYHPNAMTLCAYTQTGQILFQETYYSVGGGFILTGQQITQATYEQKDLALPYPFHNAAELLAHCKQHQLSVSQLMLENEKVWR